MVKKYKVSPGDPLVLGTHETAKGLNFAVRIPDDLPASLVLVAENGIGAAQVIDLPVLRRCGEVASVTLSGRHTSPIAYYYVIDGVRTIDPCARRIVGDVCYTDPERFNWGDDMSPEIPLSDMIIYKLHVRGFTKGKGSGVLSKGTFRGLMQKIPYLKELGINAVELMPVYEWDEELKGRVRKRKDEEDLPKKNYWGYAEHNFYFAPRSDYASGSDAAAEVRRMVSALHREGIEVFMEMYFPENTDPFMALLAIRFWKSAYHMDGFHFIGAGVPVSSIVRSPLLTGTKLIFEQIDGYWIYDGSIPKKRNILTENDSFMHVARSFVKSDEGRASEFAGMIRRNPDRVGVINYAANVNGFTLYDTVCYNEKHNEQNGEDNADGTFLNYSWNCGTEGPSRKRNVRRLRIRQMKNLLVYTFLSQGVPLLYAGDECCNSQGGNNNAYASDDPVGWVDWSSTKDAEEMRSFVAKLAAFRKMHPVFHMEKEYRGTDYRSYGCPDLSFHDTKAWVTSFENNTRTLAVMYNGMYTSKEAREADDYFYVAYNAGWTEHRFALPDLPATCSWFPSVNTQLPAGSEFANEDAPVCEDQKYCVVAPRSVVILTGKTDKAREVKNGKTAKRTRRRKDA